MATRAVADSICSYCMHAQRWIDRLLDKVEGSESRAELYRMQDRLGEIEEKYRQPQRRQVNEMTMGRRRHRKKPGAVRRP